MTKLLKGIYFVVVIIAALFIFNPNSYAATIDSNRLAGTDRFGTSVAISKSGWPNGSKNIVLASGMNFADALCSAPLAKLLDSPILLTDTSNMPQNVLDEIKRLNPETVYIVGGSGVVSDSQSKLLASIGLKNITRIGGIDRFDTSVKVAAEIEKLSGGFNSIAVASGNSFPDALSIAPIAANKGMPIILSEKDYLPDVIQSYLNQKKLDSSYIVGATGVVSDAVKTTLSKTSTNVERLAGLDRFDTNAKVLEKFESDIDFSNLYVADGLQFPDALASSALAAKGQNPNPLILSDKGTVSPKVATLLNNNYSVITAITAIGGTGVVPDKVFGLNQLASKKAKIIVVDAGHGGYQPGASGNGLVEKDINLDIALRVKALLVNEGYTTYMTRESDQYVSLLDRAALANDLGANLFVSIHQNSADNTSANGTTVLYNSQATDPARELAVIMRDEIAAALGTKKLDIQDRPDLAVLNKTNMEAVLAEVLFISNSSDAAKIADPVNRQKVAAAIVKAINIYYGFN